MSCVALRNKILRLNSLYRQGKPEVSDTEYDSLVEQLRVISPDDKFFKSGVVEKATDRMQKLPVPMFSLEKIKTYRELKFWLCRMAEAGCKDIVITPKYDGISLVVNEMSKAVWTRGDGVQGQRSDSHFLKMKNGERGCDDFELTWGEAICSRTDFESVKGSYKNARNMVAGLFNSSMGANTEQIGAVTYVRYGLDSDEDKTVQLQYLKGRYDNVTNYAVMTIDSILSTSEEKFIDCLNGLYLQWKGLYQIDGLVLEVQECSVRKMLGRKPNGNPDYAVAFKREEWLNTYTTTVESIEWNVSKDGCLCPVIKVKPVEMESATISRVTGYNAQYVLTNHIAEDSTIDIIRSGDVIPKHIRTLGYSPEMCRLRFPKVCPSCGKILHWDTTHTELVCDNDDCRQKVIAQMVYFFRTMKCEGFDEPIVRKLYDIKISSIYRATTVDVGSFISVLGKNKGESVWQEIQNKVVHGENSVARLMTALNLFHGIIGEKTVQMIIDNCEAVEYLLETDTSIDDDIAGVLKEALLSISGVGENVADVFVWGLKEFIQMHVIYPYYIKRITQSLSENCMHVCMTGFRSKELETELVRQGHEVLDNVTSKCDVLVVADLNSTSSKMRKAQKAGIRVVDRQTFEREIYG